MATTKKMSGAKGKTATGATTGRKPAGRSGAAGSRGGKK